MPTTTKNDLIIPEVMRDMISADLPKKIVVIPFATIDNTLVGRPGDTVTVPQYSYIGDAVDVAEGVDAETVKLEAGSTKFTIKKAMKAVAVTDEALLSAHGNVQQEVKSQLAKSIASKVDNDGIAVLYNAQLMKDLSDGIISYDAIVDAIDLFNEETQSEKVMFVAPAQITQLRKDTDFISADRYDNKVMMTGEIGKIAGTRVIASKKVRSFDAWYKFDTAGKLTIVDSDGDGTTTINLGAVQESLPTAKIGDKVTKVTVPAWFCPIVKLSQDSETEEDSPALTIYLKRDVNVETERKTLSRKTIVSVDEFYGAALSNQSKVAIAKFAKTVNKG